MKPKRKRKKRHSLGIHTPAKRVYASGPAPRVEGGSKQSGGGPVASGAKVGDAGQPEGRMMSKSRSRAVESAKRHTELKARTQHSAWKDVGDRMKSGAGKVTAAARQGEVYVLFCTHAHASS